MMLSRRIWFCIPVLIAPLACSEQQHKDFQVVTLEQGWQCELDQDNCWRDIEVRSDGTFVGTDSEGSLDFQLDEEQVERISRLIEDEDFQQAIQDEKGNRCGSFFGDDVFFSVTWKDGNVERASAAGCVSKEGDVYNRVFEAIADLRREFIECVDQTAPGFEDLDAVREGRIRGLCVPCGGTC